MQERPVPLPELKAGYRTDLRMVCLPGEHRLNGSPHPEHCGVLERVPHDLHAGGDPAVGHAAWYSQYGAAVRDVEWRSHVGLPVVVEMYVPDVNSVKIHPLSVEGRDGRGRAYQRVVSLHRVCKLGLDEAFGADAVKVAGGFGGPPCI